MVIQETDCVWRVMRASGPGGQHVNKTSSAVAIGWDPAPHCDADQMARLQHRLASRMDADGLIWVRAQDARSQFQNRRRAFERLRTLIEDALTPVAPRVATVRPAGAEEARLSHKRAQSERKRARQWRDD